MTTEEKAKSYDEVLKRAREELKTCGSENCDAARQIFRFFPQLREDYTKGWIIEPTILSEGVKYSRHEKIDLGNLLGYLLLFLLGLIGSGLIGMCFGFLLLYIK